MVLLVIFGVFSFALFEHVLGIELPMRMGDPFDTASCQLSENIKTEIRSYNETVRQIYNAAQNGAFASKTYTDLQAFLDKFGSRISGSENLELSINYLKETLKSLGLKNIYSENATVPRWIRGEETGKLILPYAKTLAVKALGLSTPTPKDGITADIIILKNFETLTTQSEKVKGKIVVFPNITSIGGRFGVRMVSLYGAAAVLIKSEAPMSLNTPHMWANFYSQNAPKIPVGSLSPEDGDLLERLDEEGQEIRMFLNFDVTDSEFSVSQNLIGDLVGSERPDELVLLSAHTDSWDVGQGAVDDGVGVILTVEVMSLLKHLAITPKRTIRNIFWTGEEMGLYGVRSWMSQHREEIQHYVAALEADFGCLKAAGFIFTGKPIVGCILQEILNLLPSNLTELTQATLVPTDIAYFSYSGVPSIVLNGDNGKYFWYHHTEADVLTVLNTKELDNCLAVWASTAFILADMKDVFPSDL